MCIVMVLKLKDDLIYISFIGMQIDVGGTDE